MTPESKSLKLLHDQGWLADIVERRIGRNISRDLWGFGDILAVDDRTQQFLIVQTTSASNLTDRRRKVLAEPRAKVWLAAGGRIFLHGWEPGAEASHACDCTEVEITLSAYDEA